MKDEYQEADRDHVQNWEFGFYYRVGSHGTFSLVEKLPYQIYVLGVSYWLQCKNNLEGRPKEKDTDFILQLQLEMTGLD